jgi:hypothetical protein
MIELRVSGCEVSVFRRKETRLRDAAHGASRDVLFSVRAPESACYPHDVVHTLGTTTPRLIQNSFLQLSHVKPSASYWFTINSATANLHTSNEMPFTGHRLIWRPLCSNRRPNHMTTTGFEVTTPLAAVCETTVTVRVRECGNIITEDGTSAMQHLNIQFLLPRIHVSPLLWLKWLMLFTKIFGVY